MLKQAIYHRPKNSFAYAYDKDTVHIRLRSMKGDLQKVILLHGDSYNMADGNWVYDKIEMRLAGSDDLFDYWVIEVKPPHKRLLYGFQCVSLDETAYYTERGFYEAPPGKSRYYFNFPYINPADVFQAPDWVKSTVWYQIFPERFANGDPALDPPETEPWGGEPKLDNYFGGDFQGILNHLDYLEDLGITGIYFTPIFKATTNHKYDTVDYLEIDPQFGNRDQLKALVRECHRRGIKVMLDAVFNHSSYYFGPFQDVLKNGEASPYKDWYHIRQFPLEDGDSIHYETFSFEKLMPKLNTEHPEVREYLLKVAAYWIEEFDIDGWRLDVADEVDHAFWRDFRKTVKAIKPDVYILGEVWHDAMSWLQGDQFDAVMNYRLVHAVLDFFARDSTTPGRFMEEITQVRHSYPVPVNETAFNLLGSHDTPRLLTIADNRVENVKLSFLFTLSFPGAPCIYYGDEIGLTGEADPGCRKCMVWDEREQNLDLKAFIQKLISLRKQIPAIGNGSDFTFAALHPDVVSYIRENSTEKILFVLNSTEEKKQITLPADFHTSENVWTGQDWSGKTAAVQAKSFLILSKK